MKSLLRQRHQPASQSESIFDSLQHLHQPPVQSHPDASANGVDNSPQKQVDLSAPKQQQSDNGQQPVSTNPSAAPEANPSGDSSQPRPSVSSELLRLPPATQGGLLKWSGGGGGGAQAHRREPPIALPELHSESLWADVVAALHRGAPPVIKSVQLDQRQLSTIPRG